MEWARRANELEQTTVFHLALTYGSNSDPEPKALYADLGTLASHHEMYAADSLVEMRDRLFRVKTQLDALSSETYYTARDKVFPLAHCGVQNSKAKFQNRAGYKLNQVMDVTDMWSNVLGSGKAQSEDGDTTNDAPRRRRHVTFVDICGGPGAFSQAIFQRIPKGVRALGFGLTLLDAHVGAESGWYPSLTAKKNFVASFGIDGTGDIYNSANVEAFVSVVAGGGACQLAVADGGFEVPPSQMAIQEALSARIVFSQWYVAVRALDAGGCFVLKLFDTFTRFSRSLLYLSCCWFDRVDVVKPLHSRAVNSERYLSCQGFQGIPPRWQSALETVHATGFSAAAAVRQLVEDSVMDADAVFTEAVDKSVTAIVNTQCEALQLVLDYVASQREVEPSVVTLAVVKEGEPSCDGDGVTAAS